MTQRRFAFKVYYGYGQRRQGDRCGCSASAAGTEFPSAVRRDRPYRGRVMAMSNFVDEPAEVKRASVRAMWKTRRVREVLGSRVDVYTPAFSNATLVKGCTDLDIKSLVDSFPDSVVERSDSMFVTVSWRE